MKLKLFLFGKLNQNKKIVQLSICLILTILFFYLYFYKDDSMIILLVALLFAVLTIWYFLSSNKRTSLLKKLNISKISLESTKDSLLIYSAYKRYRKLLLMLPLLIITCALSALIMNAMWVDGSISLILILALVLFLLLTVFLIISIYYLFLPKIIVRKNSISYQIIDFKKRSLFESVPFEELEEVGLGKFKGYYYIQSNRGGSSFEKTYYWLLYGIDKNRKQYIFMDFDNTNEKVIFNPEWENDMRKIHAVLEKDIPHITFNSKVRKLSNPNPEKGDEGWTDIGIIK